MCFNRALKYFSPIFLVCLSFFQLVCSLENKKEMTKEEMIKRGEYLVNYGGCNDCHSPKVFTDLGFIPDTTKLLSGHQSGLTLPRIDITTLNSEWYLTNKELTAWAGPWGISFSANLTPDKETGIGNWKEEMFINAMRNGLHLGAGRPILPPMPFMNLASLKDEDLKSIFAYLKSIKPIRNKVTEPIPPKQAAQIIKK